MSNTQKDHVDRIMAFALHTAKYQKECKNCRYGTIMGHNKDKNPKARDRLVDLDWVTGYPMALCRFHVDLFEIDHKCEDWKPKA